MDNIEVFMGKVMSMDVLKVVDETVDVLISLVEVERIPVFVVGVMGVDMLMAVLGMVVEIGDVLISEVVVEIVEVFGGRVISMDVLKIVDEIVDVLL